MIHNNNPQALELKVCRIAYDANSFDFKTNQFKAMLNYIREQSIPVYVPSEEEYPNVAYLDAIVLCNKKKDFFKFKEQLMHFEYKGGES